MHIAAGPGWDHADIAGGDGRQGVASQITGLRTLLKISSQLRISKALIVFRNGRIIRFLLCFNGLVHSVDALCRNLDRISLMVNIAGQRTTLTHINNVCLSRFKLIYVVKGWVA